jgi:hypothetical protein
VIKDFVGLKAASFDMRGATRHDQRDALAGSKKCDSGNRRLPIVLLSDLAWQNLIRIRSDYPLGLRIKKMNSYFAMIAKI